MKKKLRFIAATLLICTLTLSGTSVTKTIASDSCVADEYTKIKNNNLDVGVNRMNVASGYNWINTNYAGTGETRITYSEECRTCGSWVDTCAYHTLETDATGKKLSHNQYATANNIHTSFSTGDPAGTNSTQIHFNRYQIEVGQ